MRNLIVLLLTLTSFTLSAQFGASAFFNTHETRSNFSDVLPESEATISELNSGYEVALHYWFRLPKNRIEFQPTAYYASAKSEALNGKFNEVGFQFKTNIYLFDLEGDCGCPTFGKQGPALQKGIFLQLSPGYARYTFNQGLGLEDVNNNGFTLGGGIGWDLGVSNLLTITPFAGVRYGLGKYSDSLLTDVNGERLGLVETKLTTVQLGITATFRLDEDRY
ncbi:MAG: hypothetical protein ACJAZ9_001064 [Neolewinella sp.]|jgi:hypothetical protein